MARRPLLSLAIVLALALPAQAITVNVVYEDNVDPFFTPAARATLQKAAADVSSAITTSLAPLTQSSFTAVNGSTDATVDWTFSYVNPATGTPAANITTFDLLQDEFRVFVGSRTLGGSTLGRGGPAGAGFSAGGSGQENQWLGAVAGMETASNASMTRGGPLLGNFQDSLTLGNTSANYALDYGFAIGSLTFNDMSNWHFDYATLPAIWQSDFYSVAVHEILHAIGFGTADSFDAFVNGTDWLGAEVAATCGCGQNGLHTDQSHIRSDLEGHPLIDGVFDLNSTQEAVMDPTLTNGTRKYLTDLDLAFLRDMGWETVAIPEPSAIALLGFALAIWGARASTSHRLGGLLLSPLRSGSTQANRT